MKTYLVSYIDAGSCDIAWTQVTEESISEAMKAAIDFMGEVIPEKDEGDVVKITVEVLK